MEYRDMLLRLAANRRKRLDARLMELLADFNDAEDGAISGLIENVRHRVGDQLVPGASIVVLDDEGHRAWGLVRQIDRNVVDVDVDWDTWTTATP